MSDKKVCACHVPILHRQSPRQKTEWHTIQDYENVGVSLDVKRSPTLISDFGTKFFLCCHQAYEMREIVSAELVLDCSSHEKINLLRKSLHSYHYE